MVVGTPGTVHKEECRNEERKHGSFVFLPSFKTVKNTRQAYPGDVSNPQSLFSRAIDVYPSVKMARED